MAIYLTSEQQGSCSHLKMEQEKSSCGLIENETNPIKEAALLEIMISGSGCTHKFGPHPNSLIKLALENGLKVNDYSWQQLKENMSVSIQKMISNIPEEFYRDQLKEAHDSFIDFCSQLERQ